MTESHLLTFDEPFVRARFLSRTKRFTVHCVGLEAPFLGLDVSAHLADPGRLESVLVPGCTLFLSGPYTPPRKLAWSVRVVQHGELFISLDSTLANRLLPIILAKGMLPELPAGPVKREHTVGAHRFDLAWGVEPGHAPTDVHLGEVKTVTHLESPGVGAWPDAPSQRGRAHVQALTAHRLAGGRASLVFVAGRKDLHTIGPNTQVDPAFAELLAEAKRVGVELLGLRLDVSPTGVRYAGRCAIEVP
ncbi:MAG: hypothetical protein AUK47_09865 [Deltaproteobacteria bacterium CG2_30_63_29]|nr:MAG: hypothetical protein AUK47_09865 [Deltaproteobacteria bacterium CG2_30_63_29]PJB38226.1 MAG: sugar fermentation stimulation protein SfsA [Deltaproteobacteria bacterium CG_4_9_14_3_um_filter_63_12]